MRTDIYNTSFHYHLLGLTLIIIQSNANVKHNHYLLLDLLCDWWYLKLWGDFMTTGELIQKARKKAGLSQRQLGERLGLSASMIGQWENNLRNPKRETLKRLASALHVTIPYFDGMDDINALDIDEALKREDRRTAEKLMDLPEGSLDEPAVGYSYSDMEKCLIFSFSNLNEEGQREAVKRVDELSELPRYRRPNAPRLIDLADIDVHTETTHQPPAEAGDGADTALSPEGSEGPQEDE